MSGWLEWIIIATEERFFLPPRKGFFATEERFFCHRGKVFFVYRLVPDAKPDRVDDVAG